MLQGFVIAHAACICFESCHSHHWHHSLVSRKQLLTQTWICLETEQCQQRTAFHRHKRQVCETDGHKSSPGNTLQMLRGSVITEHGTSVEKHGWSGIFCGIYSGRSRELAPKLDVVIVVLRLGSCVFGLALALWIPLNVTQKHFVPLSSVWWWPKDEKLWLNLLTTALTRDKHWDFNSIFSLLSHTNIIFHFVFFFSCIFPPIIRLRLHVLYL